jgi:hypothetical protein
MGELSPCIALSVTIFDTFRFRSTFSFLFGTCCLLSGDIETSLANERPDESHDAVAEKIATKAPGKPQVINNQFYGATAEGDDTLYDDVKFEVSNDAVMVSSPAYGLDQHPTEASTKLHSSSYSTELPTRIYSTTASATSVEDSPDYSNSVQFSQQPYDHSDIAYSPSDAVVLDEEDDEANAIGGSYSTPETLFTEKRTEAPAKNKFSKPIFKLKPTQHVVPSTEKYVLVHTISNEKQGEGSHDTPTKKPTTNESIQSIILMLNGSNSGPEYDVDNGESVTPSTVAYGSTAMIDREQYGSSSYYITTKSPSQRPTSPSVPSTSFVYSPNPTRRVTTKTTTTKNRVKITPTRGPQRPTTLNVPSTSYVYSPNPITKRPTTTASTKKPTTANIVKKATSKPSIIVKQPSSLVENNHVVISGGGITKHPSPTVHITPKPITNILTSSTAHQVKAKPTTRRPGAEKTPSTTEMPTERPAYQSTTPGTFVSSSIYVPAIQDFHNEGYFVVTHRPGETVSSTTVYTVNAGVVQAVDASHIKLPGSIVSDPVNFAEDTPTLNNDDFSNFPPVRNPNLNMTATNMMEGAEISTPTFVEDEQLSSKIDLLVSKLVASMQGNLDNLIDIVYERKNVTAAEQDISNLNKNGTIVSAKPTARPPSRVTTGEA